MSSLLRKVRLQLDGRGQSMVEYALILVLIAIVVMVVLATMGNTIAAKFTQIESSLSGS
jgi:Flp pilus assembly pilin Flp